MWVCRLPVHIGPAECTIFTEILGEFVTSQRADVGIGPYNEIRQCIRIRRRFLSNSCFLPGGAAPPLPAAAAFQAPFDRRLFFV